MIPFGSPPGGILRDRASTLPLGFVDCLHDPQHRSFGYHDHHPEIGRWTVKDPIGFGGGDTDLYGYVLNNPINLFDPHGLFFAFWHWKLTYDYALSHGYSIRDSWNLALAVVAEDRNFSDKEASGANIHAMAGKLNALQYQTQTEALARASEIIETDPLARALHTAQDFPVHNGESMEGFGFNWHTLIHGLRDIWPGTSALVQANINTDSILRRIGPCP